MTDWFAGILRMGAIIRTLLAQRAALTEAILAYQEATLVALDALTDLRAESLEVTMALTRIDGLVRQGRAATGRVLELVEAAEAAREGVL